MTRHLVSAATALGLALALAACAPAPPPDTTAEDTTAINQIRFDWAAAYNAGDIDTLVGMYTDDYVDYPNDAPTYAGLDALRASFEQQLTGMDASTTITSEELLLLGDHAVDRGTFETVLAPEGGGDPVSVSGRYMVVLRREADGSWKLMRGMDNTAAPAMEGMGG